MMARVPSVYDDGTPIPEDWNLRCSTCGYLLTGLTSRQCPECGTAFTPRRTWEANRQREDFPVRTWADPICMWVTYVLGAGLLVLGLSHGVAWVAAFILILVEANARFGNSDPMRMRLLGIGVTVMGFALAWFL